MTTPVAAPPNLRTTRDMIRGVANAWQKQYKRGESWLETITGDTEEVWRRLSALNVKTASAADVEAIIGNRSWTVLKCDQCGREVEMVVELGQAPDYESRTADICADCLASAFALLSHVSSEVQQEGVWVPRKEIEEVYAEIGGIEPLVGFIGVRMEIMRRIARWLASPLTDTVEDTK